MDLLKWIAVLMVLTAILIPESAEVIVKPIPISPDQIANPNPMDLYKNMTRLIIEPRFKHVKVKAGEDVSFKVKLKNPTNKDVVIEPKVVISPYAERVVEEGWISFSKGKFVLKAKGEETLEISLKVPKDAEKGGYSCMIAFTNDTIPTPFPTGMPKYVNSMDLHVYVWIPPSVKIYPRNVFKYVEAGEKYEFYITVENIGDKTFKLNPKIKQEEHYMPYVETTLDESMVKITAPPTIPPHSKVKVKVEVNVPSTAEGSLRGFIDLGIDDPGLEEWTQRISVNLQVYEKPTEPFVKVVKIENASRLTVKVSTGMIPSEIMPIMFGVNTPFESKAADLDVRLIAPSGEVEAKPKILERMIVTVGKNAPPWEEVEGIYKVVSASKTYTYVINNPENGIWKVEVMPKSCFGFSIEVEVE
jgi:NACalpha-BTF3-like transcription factor